MNSIRTAVAVFERRHHLQRSARPKVHAALGLGEPTEPVSTGPVAKTALQASDPHFLHFIGGQA